ncbi:response regulator transcription factor [Novosphingobium aquimarinum]|uniref:response regulator transcription factor n=1 Tax=Novosphingobium aquimarinum TaxID=2682494 RepID=UPI0012EBA2BE|nr:LuxR C-terminal-related transcriptional regulator [Novosphingobium aquimarinum]
MTKTNLKSVAIVDEDIRRRAALSYLLLGEEIHAEPFESVAELDSTGMACDFVLMHDSEDAIPDYLSQVRRSGRVLPFVVYHEKPDARQALMAGRLGATDYLLWPFDIAAVLGLGLMSPESDAAAGSQPLRRAVASGLLDKLTPREREVLNAVTSGMTNKLIGNALGISPRTVEIHRANAFDKIGARNTSEAVRVALDGCLIG